MIDYDEEFMTKLFASNFNKNAPNQQFLVEYKDTKYYLNDQLARLHNIDDTTIAAIRLNHIEKLKVFELMEHIDDPYLLKSYANDVKEIEFFLQRLWGFPMDENFHHWFDVPKCTCPKLDNLERLGTIYKIINNSCPIHGE